MSHALNIFARPASAETMGPRSAEPSFSVGRGYRPGPGRDWSGLRDKDRRIVVDLDRVAIQRPLRLGQNENGEVIGLTWHAPEWVSSARATQLIAAGEARYCGTSGGDGNAL